eukprot:Sspe_Gene.22619::Locus_8627_Transcript_1_2_Confidence_0.500_Length_1270::g.22619::m.22619/K00789/metK; S-adenosylmethionine synthetase
MFGYATDETGDVMPLSYELARQLAMKHSELRNNGQLAWALPDAKTQVTVQYRVEADHGHTMLFPERVCTACSDLEQHIRGGVERADPEGPPREGHQRRHPREAHGQGHGVPPEPVGAVCDRGAAGGRRADGAEDHSTRTVGGVRTGVVPSPGRTRAKSTGRRATRRGWIAKSLVAAGLAKRGAGAACVRHRGG